MERSASEIRAPSHMSKDT